MNQSLQGRLWCPEAQENTRVKIRREAHVPFFPRLVRHQSSCSCKINLTGSVYPVWWEIKTQLKMSVWSNRIELCHFPLETEQVTWWTPTLWATLWLCAGALKEYKDESALDPAVEIMLFRDRKGMNNTDVEHHASEGYCEKCLHLLWGQELYSYFGRLQGRTGDKADERWWRLLVGSSDIGRVWLNREGHSRYKKQAGRRRELSGEWGYMETFRENQPPRVLEWEALKHRRREGLQQWKS